MGIIAAIGGGEIGRPGYPVETTEIDLHIKKLTGKECPKLCFIPTASEDSELYIKTVHEHFGSRIGCSVSAIELINKKYSISELEDIIFSSDIIYVGGGNTKKMLKLWKEKSLDRILKEAWLKNILLSGLSAGAICWFRYGNSDSLRSEDPNQPLILLDCLNMINYIACPHFNEGDRRETFSDMVRQAGVPGIGLENCAAVIIKDDEMETITSDDKAKVWMCEWKEGTYIETELTGKMKIR